MDLKKVVTFGCEKKGFESVRKFYPSWNDSYIIGWLKRVVSNSAFICSFDDNYIYEDFEYQYKFKKISHKQMNLREMGLKSQNLFGVNDMSKPQINTDIVKESNNAKSERKIAVTHHAIEETMKDNPRFKSKAEAEKWIIESMQKAEYIDDVGGIDRDGLRPLYAYEGTSFIVENTGDQLLVITTWTDDYLGKFLRDFIQRKFKAELSATKNKEKKIERKNVLRIRELQVERAQLSLQSVTTRSVKIKQANNERIAEIDAEINDLECTIAEVKKKRSAFAKGLAKYA